MKAVLAMLGFLLSLSIATAQNYVLSKGHAEVHGRAPGPGGDYTGVSDELKGKINTKTKELNFELNLESLKTGKDKRDRDMNKTLDMEEHPTASFKGKIESPFDVNKKETQNVTAKGKFSIHGVSKEIEVKGTLENSANGLKLNASFPVNISEYGIERPQLLSYKVEDKHTIDVSGTLQEENVSAKK